MLNKKEEKRIKSEVKQWYENTKYKKLINILRNKEEFIKYFILQAKYFEFGKNIIEWVNKERLSDIKGYGIVIGYEALKIDKNNTDLNSEDINRFSKDGIRIVDILKFWDNDFFAALLILQLWEQNQISFDNLFNSENWI